ncbi:hypothetical protein L207DRAFT_536870 [Hyaloscypha variabilis F]|uniref:Uncharacterized protein n=1 Tax=Hyaloscypha variabilis (strain UAMH 11265 / GT02V1 / F) TaxID=1149755 RepID=A0A2J6R0A3_HYAVF|nr:hypothetical protein L207DRAFT_536870 [Hyaloscypha variabilis F]
MAFESQIRTILQRFLEIPSTRYPDWTWQDVLAVIEHHRRAVTTAERFSTANNPDFLQYRAEFQIWRTFLEGGNEVAFPGIEPPMHLPVPQYTATAQAPLLATNTSAQAVPSLVTAAAVPANSPLGHWPLQLTWNRESGTPEIAVRSIARNSYPALSGPNQKYVKNLQEHWRNIFRLDYSRVQRVGHTICTLAWPEFVDSALVNNSTIARQALLQLHEFLQWWVARTDRHGNLQRIDQEWTAWVESRPASPTVLTMPWPPSAPGILQQQPLPALSLRPANQQSAPEDTKVEPAKLQLPMHTLSWAEKANAVSIKRPRSDDDDDEGMWGGGGAPRRQRIS